MKNFVNPPGPLQAFHSRYSVTDAVLSVACAWNAVPGAVFSRAWRKLWPEASLVEGSSSEEEPDRLSTKPPEEPLARLPGPGGGAASYPAGGLPGSTGPAEEGDEAFDAVVRFAEGQPCFTAQEVGQLRALRSVFVRQRQVQRQRGALAAAVKLEAPPERCPLPGSSTAGED